MMTHAYDESRESYSGPDRRSPSRPATMADLSHLEQRIEQKVSLEVNRQLTPLKEEFRACRDSIDAKSQRAEDGYKVMRDEVKDKFEALMQMQKQTHDFVKQVAESGKSENNNKKEDPWYKQITIRAWIAIGIGFGLAFLMFLTGDFSLLVKLKALGG